MASILTQIYFRFLVLWRLTFRNLKTICTPHFDQISQSMAQLLLLPFGENKRLPCGNSIAHFDFDLFTIIGMWFCTGLPTFIWIRRSLTELWRHIDFRRWRLYSRKFTSVFGCGYVSPFWMYKAICIPNFDQISQFTTVILLLSLPKSKRSPHWKSTSSFHINLFTAVGI